VQPLANLPSDQRKLLKLFKGLNEKDRAVLFAFAEFLRHRGESAGGELEQAKPTDPILVERPVEESVVSAIKRLSSSYHMLDSSTLLTETSSLMTAHLIHGKSAPDVIDELEVLFVREYQEFLGSQSE
jgi:hypothetical protein